MNQSIVPPEENGNGSQRVSPLMTPWKIATELRRRATYPYTRCYFALNGVRWGKNWRLFGTPIIQRFGGSRIEIDDRLEWRVWCGSNPLGLTRSIIATCSPQAEIVIGCDAKFSGAKICSKGSIRLGNGVRIGANSTIVDTDFHPIGVEDRLAKPTDGKIKPVVIEDDVFIGMNVMILKGTTIGRGSVVGAGSVVSGTYPPNSIIAGNPARVIREIG